MQRLIALVFLVGCGSASDTADTAAAGPEAALYDAAWEGLQGYEGWAQAPEWTGVIESESPHGGYTQIWFNELAYDTYAAQAGGEMPPGAMIVKESYDDAAGADPLNLTLMYKDADYGWYWAATEMDGAIQMDGQPDYCVSCHAAGQDSVLVVTW